MFKKIVTFFMTAALMTISVTAFAASSDLISKGKENIVKIIEVKGGISTGIDIITYNKKIDDAKKVEKLKQEHVAQLSNIKSNEEVKKITENSASTNIIIAPQIPRYVYENRYTDYDYLRMDLRRRVSPIIHNFTSSTSDYTASYTATQGYTANLTLNGGKKDALSATVGGTWSKTWSDTSTMKMSILPGEYGWVEYTPLMTNYTGYMHYQEWDSGSWSYKTTPTEYSDLCVANKSSIGSMPDGLYVLKTSTESPVY